MMVWKVLDGLVFECWSGGCYASLNHIHFLRSCVICDVVFIKINDCPKKFKLMLCEHKFYNVLELNFVENLFQIF